MVANGTLCVSLNSKVAAMHRVVSLLGEIVAGAIVTLMLFPQILTGLAEIIPIRAKPLPMPIRIVLIIASVVAACFWVFALG